MTKYPAWMQPKHHLQTLENVARGMEAHVEKIQDPELKQKWLRELRKNYQSQDNIKRYIETHRYQELQYHV